MTTEILWAGLALASFPQGKDMFFLMLMAIFFAAPLSFFLAWKDKKGEQQRESLEALDSWAELIAEFGLDDQEPVEAPEPTWRQRCHNLVDVVFDKAEAVKQAVSKTTWAVKAKVSEAKAKAEAKISEMISAAKAKAEAKAAKAKAEAEAKFRAKAEKAGFVSREDVAGMIADAIEAHEAKSHRFNVNAAFQRKLRPSDEELATIIADFGTHDLAVHAGEVVKKAVEEMTLAELREELGCGSKYNLRTLRARVRRVRDARANS